MDWLRVNTWSDHGRQVEDVRSRLVDLDRGVADGHVLVDQESTLGGAPGDLYAADGFWTLTQLLAANAWHQALLRSWCVVATPNPARENGQRLGVWAPPARSLR